jgi:hypothetical protein
MRRTSRPVRGVRSETQAELPLGHTGLDWDALPLAVREDVLTRWCELLRAVAARAEDSILDRGRDSSAEGRP